MGWYLRKSITRGPLRLNFSKSGVGASAGVKGARLSMGPRGIYIHVGAGGIYYRQRIDRLRLRTKHDMHQAPPDSVRDEQQTPDMTIVSSGDETLKTINARIVKGRKVPWIIAGLAFFGTAPISHSGLIVVLAGVVCWYAARAANQRLWTTSLHYDLSGNAVQNYAGIAQACTVLTQAARIWHITTKTPITDWKRNAGAQHLVARKRIAVRRLAPPFLTTNVPLWSITTPGFTLFFLPDRLLVWQKNRYAAVSYDALQITHGSTPFIEGHRRPHDAEIIDWTWHKVNKNGGPDRRFKYNRKLPVMLYEWVRLSSPTGLDLDMQVSNRSNAEQFSRIFQRAIAQICANGTDHHTWQGAGSGENNSWPHSDYWRSTFSTKPGNGHGSNPQNEGQSSAYSPKDHRHLPHRWRRIVLWILQVALWVALAFMILLDGVGFSITLQALQHGKSQEITDNVIGLVLVGAVTVAIGIVLRKTRRQLSIQRAQRSAFQQREQEWQHWQEQQRFQAWQHQQQEQQRQQDEQRRQEQQRQQDEQRRREHQRQQEEQRRQEQKREQKQQAYFSSSVEQDVDKAYAILYVQKGAPLDIAESAYKTAMKKAHPDAGGTDERARQLTWAIETIRRHARPSG